MSNAEQVLRYAVSQIGTTEHPRGSNRNPYGAQFGFNGVQWCSQFVWACFMNGANIDLKREITPGYSSCAAAREGWKRRGWYIHGRSNLRRGDVIFYDFKRSGTTHHTGILESHGPGWVVATEGNTSQRGSQTNGGAVLRKKRQLSSILGVGRYPFDGAAPSPPDTVDWAAVRRLAAASMLPSVAGLPDLPLLTGDQILYVCALQKALNLVTGTQLQITGIYDQATTNAVMNFQVAVNATHPGAITDFAGAAHSTTRFFLVLALQDIANGN